MAAGLNVGSVVAKFTADITNLQSGIAKAKTELSGLGSHVSGIGASVQSFFSKAGEQAQGMATALNVAGAAGAVGLGLVGKAAVSSAADFEQTKIALTTMMGSAQDAGDLLQQIAKFAAETPFTMPELATTTKQLMAFGFTANEAVSGMKTLGDISSGLNVPIGDLAYLLGTLKAQGRAMTIDIRQFAMRGLPIYDSLAQVMGVTKDKIAGLVEAGKVGFPEVNKALEAMVAEGGKFHGSMAAQATSLMGLWSTLSDVMGFTLREIIGINLKGEVRSGSIFDLLRENASKFINFLDSNKEKIAAFFGGIVTSIQNIGQSQGFQLLVSAAKTFGEWVANNKDTVIPFLQGVGIAIAAIWAGTNIITGLTAAFTALTSPLGIVILAVGLLYTAWQKDWGGIREKFDSVKEGLKTLGEAWKTAWDATVTAFTATKDTIGAIFDAIGQFFTDHKTAIEVTAGIITTIFLPSLVLMATQAAITAGQFAMAFTQTMIQAGIETAITAGKITWEFITSMVQAGIEAAKTSLILAKNFIQSLIDGAMYIGAFALQGWSMVASFVAQAWNAGVATVAMWAHNAAALAATIATGAMTAATWLLNAAILVLTSPITLVILAIVALIAIGVLLYKNWDTIKEKAGEVGAWIVSKWGEIKGAVVKYIEDLITSASEWGQHMMQNLADGISRGIEKVKETVEGVKNWIKDKLGFSYNKYMPSEVWGQHMLENFANGIQKSKDLLNSQLSSVIAMNTDGLTAAAGASHQVNQTINAQINNGTDLQFLGEKMRFMMRANY